MEWACNQTCKKRSSLHQQETLIKKFTPHQTTYCTYITPKCLIKSYTLFVCLHTEIHGSNKFTQPWKNLHHLGLQGCRFLRVCSQYPSFICWTSHRKQYLSRKNSITLCINTAVQYCCHFAQKLPDKPNAFYFSVHMYIFQIHNKYLIEGTIVS